MATRFSRGKGLTILVGLVLVVSATAVAIALPPTSGARRTAYGSGQTDIVEPVTGARAQEGSPAPGARPAYVGLADLFPEQTYAAQGEAPASKRWALLIGINKYSGGTEDAVGSRQDAKALRRILIDRGWLSSHIMLLTDYDATAKNIRKSIRWLASKTTSQSQVIFHYAGHEMPFYSDRDGDNEYRDVALWATNNTYVYDGKLGELLGKVRAAKMWIHLATCRAGGFRDKGMRKPGRVITFSSPEPELSYEDPEVGHSVMGYFTIVQAFNHMKWSDRNGDHRVTVEEAFAWAEHRVVKRTGDRQHPFIYDNLDGGFWLKVPEARKDPQPDPQPQPSPDCGLPVCV